MPDPLPACLTLKEKTSGLTFGVKKRIYLQALCRFCAVQLTADWKANGEDQGESDDPRHHLTNTYEQLHAKEHQQRQSLSY